MMTQQEVFKDAIVLPPKERANRTENFIVNGTVELTLPKSVDVSDFELKMIIASKLYEMGGLSSGQAS